MAKENSSPKEKFRKNTGIFGPKTLILALFGLFYGKNFPRFSIRDGVPLQSANIFWQNNKPNSVKKSKGAIFRCLLIVKKYSENLSVYHVYRHSTRFRTRRPNSHPFTES